MSKPETTKSSQKHNQVEKMSHFQGAQKRKETMQQVIQMGRELLPCPMHLFVHKVCYRLGLSTRKIKEDYIDILVSNDIFQMQKGQLELGNEAE